MSNSTKNFALAGLFAILIIPSVLLHHNPNYKGVRYPREAITDSMPLKQYVISFNPQELYKRLDSASGVLQYIGTSMSVDNSNSVKKYYFDVVNRLLLTGKIDSIDVKNKNK